MKMQPTLVRKDLIFPELSYKIVGALFDVGNELGSNHLEKHYQKAIAAEFTRLKIAYREQVLIPIKYKETHIANYFADFIVEDKVLLEIKKNKNFTVRNIEQVHGYLRASNLELGILANFTKNGVIFKRVLNAAKIRNSVSS
jgi:GxxExxY protein